MGSYPLVSSKGVSRRRDGAGVSAGLSPTTKRPDGRVGVRSARMANSAIRVESTPVEIVTLSSTQGQFVLLLKPYGVLDPIAEQKLAKRR